MATPRMELDFRRRPKSALLGAAVLTAGLLATTTVAALHAQVKTDVQEMTDAVLAMAPRRAEVSTKTPMLSDEKREAILARLGFRWEEFFSALEGVTPDDITLLSIAPNTSRGTVTIKGEARDLFAALRYVKSLGEGGYFHDPELTEHELSTENTALPIRFTVNVRREVVKR